MYPPRIPNLLVNERTVNIDPKALLAESNNPNRYPLAPGPAPNLPGEALLPYLRSKAETKLIKAYLIKKVHERIVLTEPEKSYIRYWMEQIKQCTDESMLRNTCIRPDFTDLTFAQLSGMDRYNLNAVPLVHLTPDLVQYGLTDLILELSHFLDYSTIETVSAQISHV